MSNNPLREVSSRCMRAHVVSSGQRRAAAQRLGVFAAFVQVLAARHPRIALHDCTSHVCERFRSSVNMQEGVIAVTSAISCAGFVDTCSPVAPGLTSLELDTVQATIACLPHLAAVSQLQHLSLLGNSLGDAVLPELLRLLSCSTYASAAEAADDCAARAAKHSEPASLINLHTLCLSGNGLSSKGLIPFLGELGSLASMVRLPRLAQPPAINPVTDQC
jgi:hypothetical protein